uniref:Dipeptidyl peptidase 9 n=1 Tax=Parascaris univalens TaxID=6257 RepID=A0A915B1G7_PARUN
MAPDSEQYDVENMTWTELLDHAGLWRNISRKGMSTSLHHVLVFTDSSGSDHLLALGGGSQSSQQTIYSAALSRPSHEHVVSILRLSTHLETTVSKGPPPAELAALWERQRTALTWGISAYEYEPSTDTLLFTDSAHIFHSRNGCFRKVGVGVSGCPLNAQLCPVDSDIVAFVANRNVHIDRMGSIIYATKSERDISNGCSPFIMQEEFDRFTGLWWSPGPEPMLVYERVDESKVTELQFSCPGHLASSPMKYPVAGSANAISTLHLISICHDKVVDCALSVDLAEQYQWYEYLARVGWLPDGSAVWAILMSRLQDRYAVVLIPVQLFCAQGAPTDLHVITLLDEQTPTWFNIDNTTKFLRSSDNVISFFHASDRNDNTHLYLFQFKLDSKGNIISQLETPVTCGEWSVSRHVALHVDENRRHVYFVANKHHPADTNLCVASYRNLSEPRVLTELGQSYRYTRMECELSLNTEVGFVCWESSLRMLPRCAFYRITHSLHDPLPSAALQYLISMPYANSLNEQSILSVSDNRPPVYPEIIEYMSANSRRPHYALLLRPMCASKGFQYPVIQLVYGGPGVQLVRNTWAVWVGYQKFTSLGYAVVMVDGRGSANRGISFEAAIKGQLGAIEVDDQIEGLNEVAKRADGILDLSRVAVMGWSYGGFMALMCLAKRPNFYRAAIAGGAVTCWNFYDTAYTERYLGLPGDHYAKSSVLEYVNLLPNEMDRLLVVHGLMDENVHFSHTEALIEALITAGKPFRLQVFPSERHGVRSPEASEFHDALVLDFLKRALAVRKREKP